jgi:hypothetical protein
MRNFILALAAILAGCGGGGGSTPNTTPSGTCPSDCSPFYLSMTDADGDFTNYTVDVVSLSLKKANGAAVETLPGRTRVNFADLVDLTEFVTAASIPNGEYVSGTIRLDYAQAEVFVAVNGMPQQAKIVDANGQPIGQVDLAIKLDNRHHLIIAPGVPALLSLDFDLAASNIVDLSKDPVEVTPQPFIVADVDVADSKEMRARGPLVSVDQNASTYTVDVRPFMLRDAKLGEIVVHTTENTAFEVDGTSYSGSAGLGAMAQLAAGAPTVAYGTLDIASKKFTAARVHAGTSVEGPQFDVIWGNVLARSGDRLTVRGVTFIRKDGSVLYLRRDATLIVGDQTKILKDGVRDTTLTKAALSVGQRIRAFGTATEAANGDVSVDAAAGRVRMHLTNLTGVVKTADPGQLVLDLASIGPHRASAYDFSGTGQSAAQDADPHNYEIATGVLKLDAFTPASPARVIGFVAPFGLAPPDFEARTVVSYQDVPSVLSMGWGLLGSGSAFLSIDANGITIDNHNSSIGARHVIATGPVLIDVKSLATPPQIVPNGTARGLYAVGEPGSVEVFSNFADFTARINEKLSAAQKVGGMTAVGSFDPATSLLTTRRVIVTFRAK